MRFKYIFTLLVIGLLISGCTNTTRQGQGTNDPPSMTPTTYDKTEVQNERHQPFRLRNSLGKKPTKDYYESNEKGIGKHGEEMNLYVTDESREIGQLLAKRTDLNNHHIAVFNNRVVVQLVTKPGEHITDRELNLIEEDIRKIEPNKEIVIYTDDVLWNRQKDEHKVR